MGLFNLIFGNQDKTIVAVKDAPEHVAAPGFMNSREYQIHKNSLNDHQDNLYDWSERQISAAHNAESRGDIQAATQIINQMAQVLHDQYVLQTGFEPGMRPQSTHAEPDVPYMGDIGKPCCSEMEQWEHEAMGHEYTYGLHYENGWEVLGYYWKN